MLNLWQRAKQLRKGGDFVALVFNRFLSKRQTQAMSYNREQLQRLSVASTAAAQHLAINRKTCNIGKLLFDQPSVIVKYNTNMPQCKPWSRLNLRGLGRDDANLAQ